MSKKRYVSSSTAQPESAPTFFLDENIGSVDVARALRDAGARVEVYNDHFGGAVEDEEWIALVAEKGWVAITKDELKARPI